MKMVLAVLTACCACFIAGTHAQVLDSPVAPLQIIGRSPTAAMIFDTGGSLTTRSVQGTFGRVAATIDQSVTVQLRYPIDLAGQLLFIQSLDGGQVVSDTAKATIGLDGTATLQLRVGGREGLYRFVLRCGDSYAVLRFYAVPPGKSSPDPTLLTASGGE
jgi:hypothetical protein